MENEKICHVCGNGIDPEFEMQCTECQKWVCSDCMDLGDEVCFDCRPE